MKVLYQKPVKHAAINKFHIHLILISDSYLHILSPFFHILSPVDSELCSQLQMTSVCFGNFTLIQLLFCLIIPWYIPAFPVFTGIIVFGFLFYRRGVSQFRRMESISQSLLLTHITTTLQGTATVAAFNQIPRFTKR